MRALPNFTPVKWYSGAGCVVCGGNYSDQGAKANVQAIDLEITDPVDGRIGLCYLHAREIGYLVGMVDAAELVATEVRTADLYEKAATARAQAEELHELAIAERENAERFVNQLALRAEVDAAKSKPRAKAAPKAEVSA